LERGFAINPVVSRVLANRGFGEDPDKLERFIRPALSSLHDPFEMRDMETAVRRVAAAMKSGEPITVFGDYDTDGTTATALMVRTLQFLSVSAGYYIPHRIEEGYGMNSAALEHIASTGAKLVLTVDNGISAIDQVAAANRLGMEVIVTDHHQPGPALPDALAVVNPNRRDCAYPNKHLTGVGVAFKFAHALLKHLRVPAHTATPFLRSLLDLVAIGTIADVAPIAGENRVLVKHGLEQIARSTNLGVIGLKQALEMDASRVTTHRVGFRIAPRLNAAGRTDHARICVELLTTEDASRAAEIAMRLEEFNLDRRNVEGRILEESLRVIDRDTNLDEERIIVVSGPEWHIGVIGIVASKIVEMYGRPVIVISEQNELGRGSARSIPSFSIHDALNACGEHLIEFGGHTHAAGLQLHSRKIGLLRTAINNYAREKLDNKDLVLSLLLDTEVDEHEVEAGLVNALVDLEPYGPSNPPPLFVMSRLKLVDNPRIVGTNHLKLQLSRGGRTFGAIAFNQGDVARELNACRQADINVAFVPIINTFAGDARVELDVKDIRIGTPV
jgi:single-stranded-DNA-specific exonuclease